MEVRLLVHAEPVASGLTWWTESPDVPGFTGTGEHLVDLRIRSESAIRDLLAERGVSDVTFRYELVDEGEPSEGPAVERSGEALEGVDTGDRGVAVAPAA